LGQTPTFFAQWKLVAHRCRDRQRSQVQWNVWAAKPPTLLAKLGGQGHVDPASNGDGRFEFHLARSLN